MCAKEVLVPRLVIRPSHDPKGHGGPSLARAL